MTKRSLFLLLFWLPAVSARTAAAVEPESPVKTLAALSDSFEQISAKVNPSVVEIFVNGYGVDHGSADVLTKEQGTASGTVIGADGLIVTNAHVVARATRIQVLVPAGGVPQGVKLTAEVVGVDTPSDLALIKIAGGGLGLKPLTFGDSSRLRQGQVVLAFGCPLGLGNTMTMGVVSAEARQLDPDDVAAYVQTDAPINPGNSGGPLVDLSGQVIGINTLILSQSGGSEGVGFAIPSNTVRYIIDQLRTRGRVRRSTIGADLETVTPEMAAALKLPQAWGVIVADVDPDGPAAASGLLIGDVILGVDGNRAANVRELATVLYPHPSGTPVTLSLLRDNQKISLSVKVEESTDDPTSVLDLVRPEQNLVPELDVLGVDLDPKLAAALPDLREDTGVLVAAMSADASPPADRFQAGDVIHAVGRTPVHSLTELRKAVAGMKDGDPIVVQIARDGAFLFIAFEID
jgi:serine protease Do